MRKIKTQRGYIAYSCRGSETALIGGMGICDDCGTPASMGYLVPVLNHYMCPECFTDAKTQRDKN